MKRRIHSAALVPAAVVALAHFSMSMILCRPANLIFQRSFDTGEIPNRADDVVVHIYRLIDVPLPVLLLAGHPARTTEVQLWALNGINSLCWAAATYLLYVSVPLMLRKRRSQRTV